MPRVDSVWVHGGDPEIAFPTDPDISGGTKVNAPPDFPPESFWFSKDAEYDWFDRNAFLERKESTKRNSSLTNLKPSRSNSNSQWSTMSLKSKATIIGLPKTAYVDSKRRRCRPANIRFFPKRSDSAGKAVSMTEPSSPKVSCMGRVRSRRCRSRRKSSRPATEPEKPVSQHEKTGKGQKTGIISRIASLFRSEGQRRRKVNKPSVKANDRLENSASRRKCVTVKPVDGEPAAPIEVDPPSLGGMTRFSSGRRSELRGGSGDINGAGRRAV